MKNAAGGINGQKVEVVLKDELCDPKEAGLPAISPASTNINLCKSSP